MIFKDRVTSNSISTFLGLNLVGEEVNVYTASSINDLKEDSLVFVMKYDESILNAINQLTNALIICSKEYSGRIKKTHMISPNPRLDFIRVLNEFGKVNSIPKISPTASVESMQVGKNLSIGNYSTIEEGAIIGDDVSIGNNVTIRSCVKIGSRCRIKSGTVIGEEGFGFETDESGIPVQFQHYGTVELGDDVFIGSNSTIERATLGKTYIDDFVKVDDLVQIGHNCHIGKATYIMAGVILCGGVIIGERCNIAPITVIKQKLRIGDGSSTGLGSVVVKDVLKDTLVYGNPARQKESI